MKNALFILLIIALQSNAKAQDDQNNGYTRYSHLDTVVSFEEGINEYSFLWSKQQGFYWDTISHNMDCHRVVFHILNDTPDTIFINRIGGGDGALLYRRENFNESYNHLSPLRNAVYPNQILKISVKLYSIEHRQNFDKSLMIRYTSGRTEGVYGLNCSGHFIKNYRKKEN